MDPYRQILCDAAAIHVANLHVFYLKILNYQHVLKRHFKREACLQAGFDGLAELVEKELQRQTEAFCAYGFEMSPDFSILKSISTLRHVRIRSLTTAGLQRAFAEDVQRVRDSARRMQVCQVMEGEECDLQASVFIEDILSIQKEILEEMKRKRSFHMWENAHGNLALHQV